MITTAKCSLVRLFIYFKVAVDSYPYVILITVEYIIPKKRAPNKRDNFY
jgi:hypothetical protein